MVLVLLPKNLPQSVKSAPSLIPSKRSRLPDAASSERCSLYSLISAHTAYYVIHYIIDLKTGGVRQTRISFEIHPSLILYDDLIHESGHMESGNISDDEEESVSGKK